LSYGDVPQDEERIELYCRSSECGVREFTILALNSEKHSYSERADVRALAEIDDPQPAERGEPKFISLPELVQQKFPTPEEILARRNAQVED
jgi:hypothetical protein